MRVTSLPIAKIVSEADFILFSPETGLLSEHFTEGEARMAYYKEAACQVLGHQLPIIYERQEPNWVPLN